MSESNSTDSYFTPHGSFAAALPLGLSGAEVLFIYPVLVGVLTASYGFSGRPPASGSEQGVFVS